jgi:hypothetical protein
MLELSKTAGFSAVTLACCAIDLLTHTYYNPISNKREDSFVKTVRKKLSEYDGDGKPERIYELRCGLVHEFRTHGATGQVYLTKDIGVPDFVNTGISDYMRVDVDHFCRAVYGGFEKLFLTKDDTIKRRFVDKAYITVIQPQIVAPCTIGSLGNQANFSAGLIPYPDDEAPIYTATPPASGSGGPPPEDLRYGRF